MAGSLGKALMSTTRSVNLSVTKQFFVLSFVNSAVATGTGLFHQANNGASCAFNAGFRVNPNHGGGRPFPGLCAYFVACISVVVINKDRTACYSIPHPTATEMSSNPTRGLKSALLK